MGAMQSPIHTVTILALCVALVACSGSAQTPEPSQPENSLDSRSATADDPGAGHAAATATESAPSPANVQAAEDGAVLSKEEVLEQTKALMFAMAEAVKSTADNCDSMAVELQKIADDAQPLKQRVEELEQDPESKAWLDAQSDELMKEVMPAMMEAMQAAQNCKDHEGVKRAMESM